MTYKIKEPKATLKIFSTGSITVTARSVANVQAAIEHIYPLVYEYQKPKAIEDIKKPIPELGMKKKGAKRKRNGGGSKAGRKKVNGDSDNDSEDVDDDLEDKSEDDSDSD